MVKIGENGILGSSIKNVSNLGADLKKKIAVPPTAGASKVRSSSASGEQRSSLENSETVSAVSENTNGKGKGQIENEDTSSKISARSKKEFYKNTLIIQEDVGKSLLARIEETDKSADPVTELSPTETQFLNDMLYKGYVSHKMYLDEGLPVSFRSCPPIALQNGDDILGKHSKASNEKMSILYTCMVVGVYLESYGDKDNDNSVNFSHEGKGQKDFASPEAIEERFDFCSNQLNGIILDVLNKRLIEFLSLLGRVGQSRNVLNF